MQGARDIFFPVTSIPVLRPTQPPIQWLLADVSLGLKQQGHETDHSSPCSAEVKNDAAILPLPNTSSVIKPGHNFTHKYEMKSAICVTIWKVNSMHRLCLCTLSSLIFMVFF
jgi:hypothetical protein